jgi:hypothetical protein
VQQGQLNFLYLARAMVHPTNGFGSNPAFQFDDRTSFIDTAQAYYDGNSQGGIYGGVVCAVSVDVHRCVLGVPGMNYSMLLARSSDYVANKPLSAYDPTAFSPGDPTGQIGYSQVFDTAYPDQSQRQLIFDLIQNLWDRSDPNGYAGHMTHGLPNTPDHHVLLQVAYGDHQVANVTAETEARTIGAALRCPPLDPGRTAVTAPFWGLACIDAYPYTGSAIVFWDSHNTPESPLSNTPAHEGADPHGFPRGQVANRAMKGAFLRGEGVVDGCAGHPCP